MRLAALDPYALALLRGPLQACGTLVVLLLLYRGRTPQAFRALGPAGLALCLLYGLGNLLFLLALDSTSVANVMVFIATIPLFAALFGRTLLGERLPGRTWTAIGLALAGIGVVAGRSLGEPTLAGDSAAVAAALCFALFFVLVRRRPEVDVIPAVVLAGLLYPLLALPFLTGAALAALAALGAEQLLWIGLDGLLVLPVAYACIVTGPRYLPAAEVGLLLLLETLLGPLWVWLALGEAPPATTLLGGGIVLATLAWHSLAVGRR